MTDRTLQVSIAQASPVPLDVTFSCAAGDVLGIFGPSGAGKTTILRAIAGLYTPASGRISAGGATWLDTAAGVQVPPHRRQVGFVFQEHALFPHMTALGNVMTALGHRPPRERRARAEALLAQVRLSDRHDRRPATLSGGERQRVAIARAMARDPAVLLLDEPFAAVNRQVRRRLQDEIESLRSRLDIPLVLVTHDFDDIVRLATHLLVLERGTAAAAGPIQALTSRPDLDWLRDAAGLGSVIDARVARVDRARRLAELTFDGGSLFVADPSLALRSAVRVRIPARDVILATGAPAGLSLHNVLRGTVTAVRPAESAGRVVVQIAVGGVRLLSEVTPDAIDQLHIGTGTPLYVLIKSVSLEVRASGAAALRP